MKDPDTSVAVDAYISSFPSEVRKVLRKVRQTIRKAAPMAGERISYTMPTYSLNKDVIVHFGAFKAHIGFYPPVRDAKLQDRVAAYRGPGGNLRFPLDQPIPYGLISDIVKSRLQAHRGKHDKRKRKQNVC